MHAHDSVHQIRKLTYVIGHANACLHLWKLAAWRLICRGLIVDFCSQLAWDLVGDGMQRTKGKKGTLSRKLHSPGFFQRSGVKYLLTCRKLLLRCLWKNIKVQWRVPGENKYMLSYTFFVCFRERPFEIKQYEPGPSCTENETIGRGADFQRDHSSGLHNYFHPDSIEDQDVFIACKEVPSSYLLL